jgi:hypothetical protein
MAFLLKTRRVLRCTAASTYGTFGAFFYVHACTISNIWCTQLSKKVEYNNYNFMNSILCAVTAHIFTPKSMHTRCGSAVAGRESSIPPAQYQGVSFVFPTRIFSAASQCSVVHIIMRARARLGQCYWLSLSLSHAWWESKSKKWRTCEPSRTPEERELGCTFSWPAVGPPQALTTA